MEKLGTFGQFGTLLLDPPWLYQTYDGKVSIPQRAKGPQHYPSMSFDELAALEVQDAADDDCAMFMWIIDTHLDQALRLGTVYGFTFKTIAFVWDKGRMSFGLWTRKEAEICLMFTRGAPRRLHKDVRQIIREKPRQHSRKPDGQYGRIERLVGGPRLELFNRKARPGWAVWGQDAELMDGRNLPPRIDLGPLMRPSDLIVDHK